MERVETVVIGAGQAGLSVAYHLKRLGRTCVILDANERVGDSWRHRWDTLRLFTPARFDGLDGLPFPGDPEYFPTKDEMADYLETYARHFGLVVRQNSRVDRLSHDSDGFTLDVDDRRMVADNVVVAMGTDQRGRRPSFAARLDPGIVQMHSIDYRRPSQLRDGSVLVVGAANSGVEIALDLADSHHVIVSGDHPRHIPFDIEGFVGRKLLVRVVLRGVFHRLLSLRNPVGRRVAPSMLAHGKPLVRSRPADLIAAGVERCGRVVGVRDGKPVVDGETALDVQNVIWATGFVPGFDWIDIDLGGDDPRHHWGEVEEVPGLYFVGLDFLYAASSGQIHGVGRDAARIAGSIAVRTAVGATPAGV